MGTIAATSPVVSRTNSRGTKPPEVSDTGFPSSARVALALAGVGATAGVGALIGSRSTMGMGLGAGMGALIGVAGALVATAMTWDKDRPKIGQVDGVMHYQVKVGEEAYTTTCTETFSDSSGSHTHTFPCTKVRGIYEDRWADITEPLSLRSGIGGKTDLENVVDRFGTGNSTYAIIRVDGQYQARRINDGNIDFPESYYGLHDGVVAIMKNDDVIKEGPALTAEERQILLR